MEVLRKYGVATTILFPLVDRGAIDFESTPVTFVAADTQISKNEGAFANTGSTPAHEGNGIYSLALTATEMQAARIMITCIDAATKTWEDQAIIIATYGNASAQHAFDLDLAEQTVALSAQGKLDVNAEADTALTDYDPPTGAELVSEINAVQSDIAALNDPTVGAIADQVWEEASGDHVTAGTFGEFIAVLASILADTGELQSDWVNGGRLDLLIDAIKAVTDLLPNAGALSDLATILADTNELQVDDVPGLIAALNDPTAAAIADQVWDEAVADHVADQSFGAHLQGQIVRADQAQAGAATSITLDASASATDEIYTGLFVTVYSGTGAGQTRQITAYNGTTKVATVATWITNPASGSKFVLSAALEGAGGAPPTAAAIADAVWDEASAGHTDAGKAGEQQWTDIDAILADTNELQTDDVPALIAAVQSDTDDIQTRLPAALVSGRMDSSVGAMAAAVLNAAAIASDAITAAKIAANALTSAKFATGAINANAIAADAIGASELAADAVNKIVDQVWDELVTDHVADQSFGAHLQGQIVRADQAQAGAATTITLDAGASATDDLYNGLFVTVYSGAGVGQTRQIDDYDGATKVATVNANWTTNPASGSRFVLHAAVTGAGGAPSTSAIADAVWDEAKSGHVGAGSMGEEVQAHALTSELSAVEADTQDIQGRLPAALVSGRMDSSVGAMAAGVMTAAAIAADALTSAKMDATFGQEIADEILKRGLSNAEPSPGLRTVYGALASLVNRVKINGSNLEIYETNDTTLVASIPITTDSGQNPITELDPA